MADKVEASEARKFFLKLLTNKDVDLNSPLLFTEIAGIHEGKLIAATVYSDGKIQMVWQFKDRSALLVDRLPPSGSLRKPMTSFRVVS